MIFCNVDFLNLQIAVRIAPQKAVKQSFLKYKYLQISWLCDDFVQCALNRVNFVLRFV